MVEEAPRVVAAAERLVAATREMLAFFEDNPDLADAEFRARLDEVRRTLPAFAARYGVGPPVAASNVDSKRLDGGHR